MIQGKQKNWRLEKPTERQKAAIYNMSDVLGMDPEIPLTKGECCDLITKLIKQTSNFIEARACLSGWDSDWEWVKDTNSIFDI